MLKKKKLFSLVAPVAAASIILAACGAGSETGSETGGSTSEDGTTKLVGGTEATFAPFESMDDNGNIVGIDVDVLNAISEEMDFDYELKNIGWEPVFSQITTGEIDFGAAGITITDERKESYDFTDPYFESTLLIVVPEDNTSITSVEDLKDKKVSVQINSTSHEAAKKILGQTNPDILAYENQPLAIQDVINGTADAALGDNAVLIEYMKNNPDAPIKTIEDDSFEKEYYGLMVKKGNEEVLNLLNDGLKKIKENGKLAEITGQEIE
ncbi:basic amino acid ABC transporter substrate-binding protein [Ureibacillus aquaedulcis]|uniref:Basic amino acid ABC transporter substrate-binding protein n=1 Tax=Ureibacillus aquaedulcis TaxID=3058421 RepID=A0ABT8GNY2_9BACL|nr:basic amino acid ABC transporter substrate-binding protein [Ureibacillus sp. BA0131]MDN4493120.1 basic amino acid ABC transporter substrate-binding protein [Ureibacillus sp. BA0131]